MKKLAWRECQMEDLSWSHFFAEFPYKIFVIVLLDILGLENFPLSFSKSIQNHDM